MLKKFLKDVVVITVGKQAEEIAELLHNKIPVNEFIIAKKLNVTINQTRNILYKLSDYGLVSSIRKKDKKKGWYTYFWKIEVLKTLEFLKNILRKNMDQLKNQLKSMELKEFYVCERCNIEFNEESALAYDFTCNECGDIFSVKDKSKDIKMFKKDLARLERELELVNIEIKNESEILEKKRLHEIEKEKKIKDEAKKEATKKRKTARDKAKKEKIKEEETKKKKSSKKKIVKKIVKKKSKKK